jgi:hypothetical protein
MTRLFEAVVRAGGVPDFSNDDLQAVENGLAWTCPVTNAHALGVEPLFKCALRAIGDDLRGVELRQREVVLYLHASYRD